MSLARLQAWTVGIVIVIVLAMVSAIAANELLGGIWSVSRLYPYAFCPEDQTDPERTAYEFARLQIVHDESLGSPIRLVRVFANQGDGVVIFDRSIGPEWSSAEISSLLDAVYPGVPAPARALWAAALDRQIDIARQQGARAAERAASDQGHIYLMYFDESTSASLTDEQVLNSTVSMGSPGLQVWNVKLLEASLLWSACFAVMAIVTLKVFKAWRDWRRSGRRSCTA